MCSVARDRIDPGPHSFNAIAKMKYIVCAMVFSSISLSAAIGQNRQDVTMDAVWVGNDSLQVLLNLESVTDSLNVPIWAIQFDMNVSENLQFTGTSTIATLASKDGWTVGSSIERLRVAAFSSSLQAIQTKGTLLALLFVRNQKSKSGSVCMTEFRLNSGDPEAYPLLPCVEL